MTTPMSAQLPKGWKSRRLGECAEFINGRAYSQHELLDSGTPVLRIQNLNGGDRWYYSNLTLPNEKYCHDGDLLYAWSASFGPYRFAGPKSIFHYHIWRVIPGEELDKDFAFHLLSEITAEVKSAAHGVTMLHMTKGGIEAWPISLPPLDEQRRIAGILDQADELRAKRRAALAQLDELTQAIFDDMFVGDKHAKGRWVQRKVAELSSPAIDGCVGGPFGSDLTSSDYVEEPGVPVIRGQNLATDEPYVLEDGYVFVSEVKADALSRNTALRGDILVSQRGARLAGQVAMIPPTSRFDRYIVSQSQMKITPDLSQVDPIFLVFYFRSIAAVRRMEARTISTGVPHINLGILRDFEVDVPPLPLQRKFALRVTAVETLKTAHRASLTELDALFASLQHRAFRGEL